MYRLFILILLFSLLNVTENYAKDSLRINSIDCKLGIPVSNSKNSFRKYWFPFVEINVAGIKYHRNQFVIMPGFDYSRFFAAPFIKMKSRLHILSPTISIGYLPVKRSKIVFMPELSIGYSWLCFTNPYTPLKYVNDFNKSGFSIKPGMKIKLKQKERYAFGLYLANKFILQQFGNDDVILYENRKESKIISYCSLGIYFDFNK